MFLGNECIDLLEGVGRLVPGSFSCQSRPPNPVEGAGTYCSRTLQVPWNEIKQEVFTLFLSYHQRLGGDSSSLHHILVNNAHPLRTHSQVGYEGSV